MLHSLSSAHLHFVSRLFPKFVACREGGTECSQHTHYADVVLPPVWRLTYITTHTMSVSHTHTHTHTPTYIFTQSASQNPHVIQVAHNTPTQKMHQVHTSDHKTPFTISTVHFKYLTNCNTNRNTNHKTTHNINTQILPPKKIQLPLPLHTHIHCLKNKNPQKYQS